MGWCMLPALVDPSFAAYLLERGRQRREERAAAGHDRAPFIKPGTLPGPGSPAHGFGRDEEPFHSLMFSQRMARNAQRLCDREPAQPASQPVLSHAADYKRACLLIGKRLKGADVPMRYRIDIFGERPPGGAGATPHQDACEHGSDRVGELQFWLALAAVSPEMGAMRFVNASHKEGPLGSVFNGDEDDEVPLGKGGDLLAQYPNLVPELGLSDIFSYIPGDCTVHAGYTVHLSPANTTEESRWSWLFSYSPADVRYWNGDSSNHGAGRTRLEDRANPLVGGGTHKL